MQHRSILHADMDAFYAAVEQRNRPSLRGKPVIVGGRAEDRGVVATASYEARRFGVHSAMPTRTALRLCPQAVLLPPDFAKYRTVSQAIFAIYREWTPLIEPISLDEAYLDLTENVATFEEAIAAGAAIRDRVQRDVGLTVSVGVGTNKLVAKIASDLVKPNGLTVVPPGTEREFLAPLPVGRLWGVGPKAAAFLRTMGVNTVADLAQFPSAALERHFGRSGRQWHEMAEGVDDRPVTANRPLRQVSRETTFPQDVADPAFTDEVLRHLANEVMERIVELSLHGYTVSVKVRFEDFRSVSRQVTLGESIEDAATLIQQGQQLLRTAWTPGHQLRLLGIGVTNFHADAPLQLSFFDQNGPMPAGQAQSSLGGST